MKKDTRLLQFLLPVFMIFAFAPDANSQILKKLGKRAEKAAERVVERRVEEETTKKTDQVLDSILEPGKKGEQEKQLPLPQDDQEVEQNGDDEDSNAGGSTDNTTSEESAGTAGSKDITIYSKFDFVPGDKVLFFDNFKDDFIGDFPAKWNTNGSGEVVTIGNSPDRWMQILPGHNTYYVPDVPDLPEEYTIEFDIMTIGIDKKTSSAADISIWLSDDNLFKRGKNHVRAEIPFCQYTPIGIRMKNHINNMGGAINNVVDADIRNAVIDQPHISIAVNKQRYRLWVNEKKYIDIPRIIETPGIMKTLKFSLATALEDGKEKIFISNLKVAEGGVDLRRKLLAEGRISTNAILFDSGSANLQPQSMGIIRQISQVLQQDSNISLQIVGHTDSDGNDDTNLGLSKKRAQAVKNALVSVYNVDAGRLSFDGKGESEPLGDNGTTDGKAQNRRVEFIKM